jgi:hypothetical protein
VASPLQRLISAIVLALVCGGFGAFLLFLGVREVLHAQRLSESATTIEARAFDWSTVTGDGPTGYELHYEFVVGGTTYSASDATGREGLWQEVPFDVWEASQRTGTLTVRYVPGDPWINEPAVGDPGAMGDHLAGVVLGAACCLGALVLPLFALFGRRR